MKALSEKERLFSRSEFYKPFIRRRSRLSWSIVVCSIGLVLAFSVVSIFFPSVANFAIYEQGAATMGITFAVLIIVVIVLAAIYFVHWNNREHARISQIIRNEFVEEPQE